MIHVILYGFSSVHCIFFSGNELARVRVCFVVRFLCLADCGNVTEVASLRNPQHRWLHSRLRAGSTWSTGHSVVQAWND